MTSKCVKYVYFIRNIQEKLHATVKNRLQSEHLGQQWIEYVIDDL